MSGSKPPLVTTALLVAGAAIGAGILGLPVQTGVAGMIPSLVGLLVMAVALLATAWVIADRWMKSGSEDLDLANLFHNELGPTGKWMAVVGYLLNYNGIMVAYLAGAATVLASLLGMPHSGSWLMLAFFVPATAIALFGVELVRRANAVLMAILLASFLFLLWQSAMHLEPARLARMDWEVFPATLPIIMTSLVFHNMVPVVCRAMGGRRRWVLGAMALGLVIPLTVCILWTGAVVGALPLEGSDSGTLMAAFESDQPATVPLAEAMASPSITVAGLVFSLCAIFTSYVAVGTALMGFWADLVPKAASRGWMRAVLAFAPALIIVYLYPDLFLEALNLAGGLGVGLVFGLCPALILVRFKGMAKLAGWLLLAFFAVMICLELAQEAGWLPVLPPVEHWTSTL